ncbi:hypothetical protein [Bifidobacterium stellenboschense]|uniref:Uncharacterized protein n=1 Tax=Bifidobacterium stellenboschense TaxID=762211 RepID=A0A087DQX0_9BIFI|nr:hypothetical protein [Bifidobacterium stellenboschense]KFI97920.1 hypothetical protein BSTEL_0731 [Bifidobacterium stellenboschense]
MTTFEGRTLDQDTLMEAIRLASNDKASAQWLTHVADNGKLAVIAAQLAGFDTDTANRYLDATTRLRRWGGQIGPAISMVPASYAELMYGIVESSIGDTFRYALGQRDPVEYVAESKRLADRYLRELPGAVDLTALAHAVQMAGPDDYGTCLVGRSMLDSVFLAASATGATGQTSTRRQAAAASSAPSSTSASATSEQSSFADFMNRLKIFNTAEALGEQMMLYFGVVAAAFVFAVAPLLWDWVAPDGGPIADFAKISAIGAVIGAVIGVVVLAVMCAASGKPLKTPNWTIAIGYIVCMGGTIYAGMQMSERLITVTTFIQSAGVMVAAGFVVCALIDGLVSMVATD